MVRTCDSMSVTTTTTSLSPHFCHSCGAGENTSLLRLMVPLLHQFVLPADDRSALRRSLEDWHHNWSWFVDPLSQFETMFWLQPCLFSQVALTRFFLSLRVKRFTISEVYGSSACGSCWASLTPLSSKHQFSEPRTQTLTSGEQTQASEWQQEVTARLFRSCWQTTSELVECLEECSAPSASPVPPFRTRVILIFTWYSIWYAYSNISQVSWLRFSQQWGKTHLKIYCLFLFLKRIWLYSSEQKYLVVSGVWMFEVAK